jgi:hypothetical protein
MAEPNSIASPLLTEVEAAKYLRVSLSTLRRNRTEMRPPKFLKLRGRVLYTQKALDQYIAFSERG